MSTARKIPLHKTKAGASGRINTIGLQGKDLEALFESLDSGRSTESTKKRDFVRWPFRQASLLVHVFQNGGSNPTPIHVACRNLSCGGISLLHSAYIHLGTKVQVTLPHPERGNVSIPAFVVRCTHLRGVIHEIGVKFNKPIQAREYFKTSTANTQFSLENVEAGNLVGTLIYVDDSDLDLRIVRHYLRETQLRLRTAPNAEEGLKLAREGCDLILADYQMPGMTGVDFAVEVRKLGINTPIIITTSDTSPLTRQKIESVSVNGFLAKPVTQDMLLRAVAEFLVASKDGTVAGTTSLDRDNPNYVLVEAFIGQIPQFLKRLNDAITRDDEHLARTVALQLKGLAPTLGFDVLGNVADEAATMLAATASVTESLRSVRSLIASLERASAAGAA